MPSSEQKKEDWMNSKWRPAMGWLYMLVCAFDFIIFPILWSLLQSISHGIITSQWQPLTLQGAGLFHVSMGAVLGISAYGRTKEKIAGAENGGLGDNYAPVENLNTFISPPVSTKSSGTL
jgi:Holin of 3TMs, for gene-transfer release